MTASERARYCLGVCALTAASCARTELSNPEPIDVDTRQSGGTSGSGGTTESGGVSSGGSGVSFGGSFAGSAPTGGTSGVATGGSSSSGTGGTTTDTHACPFVAGPNTDPVVLSFVSRDELLMLHSSGQKSRVNAAANGNVVLRRVSNFLILARESEGELTVSLVERAGNVKWTYYGTGTTLNPERLWVNELGDASLTFSSGLESTGLAVLSSGQSVALPGPPLDAPDASGWVPVASANFAGFVNVVTGQVQNGPPPIASSTHPAFVSRGKLIYLAAGESGPGIAFLAPGDDQYFPLENPDLSATELLPTGYGGVLVDAGVPRVLASAVYERFILFPVLTDDLPFDASFHQNGSFGLVVRGQVPRYGVGLAAANVFPLVRPAYEPRNEATLVVVSGYAAALGANTSGMPIFLADFPTGRVATVDLAPLAPQRVFPTSDCMKPPVLLDDGRVAFGLRDDATAAIYGGHVNEFPWTRVGRPVSHVVGIGARRYRLSWVVSAISGENTLCDGGPWPARETLPPGTPLGDSVQVVTADSEVVFEDHRLEEFVFHETGACAAVRGVVHDFPTGARFELPADATELTFW